jgi:hypothetical protein
MEWSWTVVLVGLMFYVSPAGALMVLVGCAMFVGVVIGIAALLEKLTGR